MVWVQPALTALEYELRDGEATVARLEFEPLPNFSWEFTNPKAARATAADARWRFTISRSGPGGFFGFSASVTVSGSNRATVELGGGLSRGELRIDGRRSYQWRGKLVRDATSTFSLPDAQPTALMRFRSGSPTAKITTRVELTTAGEQIQEWRLLAALGFYLRIIMGRTWR